MINLEKQLPDPVTGRASPQPPHQRRYSKCFLDEFRFLLSLNDEEIDAFLKEGRVSSGVKAEGIDGTTFPDNKNTMPASPPTPLMRQPKSTSTPPTPDALTLLAASIPLPPPSPFELMLMDNNMASELHDLCDEMFENIGNKDLEWAADSTKSMGGGNTAMKSTSIKKFLGRMKKVRSTINLKYLRKTKVKVV